TMAAASTQTMTIIKTLDNCFMQSGLPLQLYKTDTAGTLIWAKNYDGMTYNNCDNNFAQTSDSGFIITASVPTGLESILIKTDKAGDTLWTRTLAPAIYTSYGMSVKEISGGGF